MWILQILVTLILLPGGPLADGLAMACLAQVVLVVIGTAMGGGDSDESIVPGLIVFLLTAIAAFIAR